MKKLLLSILLVIAGSNITFAQCSASFTSNIASAGGPVMQFINYSSGDSTSGQALSFTWNFGDGSPTDTFPNPIHTFPAYGVYNVCLTMMDWTGCTDSICIGTNVQQPPPTINSWFIADSMGTYACTAPDTVLYYFSIYTQNFSVSDTIFNVLITWGDGSDTTWTFSGVNSGSQGSIYHQFINAGNYTANMTVTSATTSDSSVTAAQQVVVTSSCGPLAGSVYNDINGNCIFDSGEELANMIVTLFDGATMVGWTQTDANGVYSFNVPTSITYDISIQTNNGYYGVYTPTCPSTGIINSVSVPSSGNNFGVDCPQGADLTGHVTNWGFRPGFVGSVCVNAYNIRCTTPTGSIQLTLDPLLTPLPDTSGIGYTVSGQVVTFPIGSPDLHWNFCFPVQVSLGAQIGDTACIGMNIIVPGDSVPSNNTGTYCFPIRNSFDPNDKSTAPSGAGVEGYILPNTPLTYTIRFQNTGNDLAYNIYVLDSLDANLDVLSLEVLGASHPFSYSVLTGNILRFNFDNIMLADSNTNEAASHGYVVYRINQISSIAQSAEIHNTAGIYFDFNQPIITNTTLHTIDYFLSVPKTSTAGNFSVYPNPAYDNCMIRFIDNSVKIVTITDAIGKVLFRANATSILEINTSAYANGMYTIRVESNSVVTNSKLIIGSR